ncbi:MAG: hypothetical protein ACRD2J_17405 [Thermoanaerobaculia bacterium]
MDATALGDLIPFLKAIAQSVRLVLFAGFVALAMAIRFAPAHRRRAPINLLLAYSLIVNAFVGFVGTDAWPFSPYPMMSTDARDRERILNGLAFRLVHADGSESKVDPLAFSPLYPQSVMGWLETRYQGIDPAKREVALRFLHARADEARRMRLSGDNFGNRAILGPLAAPDTNLYWTPERASKPSVGLRIYRFRWNPGALAADPSAFERELFADSFGEPPRD